MAGASAEAIPAVMVEEARMAVAVTPVGATVAAVRAAEARAPEEKVAVAAAAGTGGGGTSG
eukprot:1582816-Prymnesium_polylepis.1